MLNNTDLDLLNEFDGDLEKILSEIIDLRNQKDSLQERISELEDEVRSLEERNSDLEGEIGSKETEIEALRNPVKE